MPVVQRSKYREIEIWTSVQGLLFCPRRDMPSQVTSPKVGAAVQWLERATRAPSSRVRADCARRGLRTKGAEDATLRAMLLRQLYLANMEDRKFRIALERAVQLIDLGVMSDVARQDAARACLGLNRVEEAVGHLRVAARVSPASRKAFHYWTLGSIYYLVDRFDEAVTALTRATLWGTTDKPLYRGQLALARRAAGQHVPELEALRDALDDAPCGQGYGKFVLGELALCLGDRDEAAACLGSFVRRTSAGRIALQVALERELAKARQLLGELDQDGDEGEAG